MKKFIAGNWKMNMTQNSALAMIRDLSNFLPELTDKCDLAIFAPFVYLADCAREARKTGVIVGAQDCSVHDLGAYTGEVSASMIRDCGASHVILGHSERRQYHHETSAIVKSKALAAYKNDLCAVICVGETLKERENGQAKEIIQQQLIESIPSDANSKNTIIAYEPVWAIGTGKTAHAADVAEMHAFIREKLSSRFVDFKDIKILYGGSMKPENARELLAIPNVDGGLIGGASLKSDDFLHIARCVA